MKIRFQQDQINLVRMKFNISSLSMLVSGPIEMQLIDLETTIFWTAHLSTPYNFHQAAASNSQNSYTPSIVD